MSELLRELPERLSPVLNDLREHVFRRQGEVDESALPELTFSDAVAWEEHGPDEPWIIWRGRRTAGRLRAMPVEILPGESIVGTPHLRRLSREEAAALTAVRDKHINSLEAAGIPPWPGGEAGHFHPDYGLLFELGIDGLRDRVRFLSESAPDSEAGELYAACNMVLEGMSDYIRRTAALCRDLARENEAWTERAERCERLAGEPPATFHDAIQLMWFAIIALWFGEDHGLTTPGRMDQTLRPFYEADLASGLIDARRTLNLISELFIHCNRLRGPGSAISVLVGGRDAAGRDVTNDLTWLCLAARQLTHLVYPTVAVAWHEGTPAELMDYSCRLLASGIGDPAFFNDELIACGLREHGVSEADSFNYMNSTCVEIKVCGASNIWVTQPYINCPQGLLDVMADIASGALPEPDDFQGFTALVRDRLSSVVREAALFQDQAWRRREEFGGFPLASCLISDCLVRGRDYDRGGARYHWVENSFVGLANLCDSLLAVRGLVYETGELTMAELYRALEEDFEGHEEMLGRIRSRMPRYGRDEAAADALAAEWARFLIDSTEDNIVGGHRYVPGFFCWIQHGILGGRTMATPDGRCAGEPFADGAGAAQGRETAGPTASVLSTTSWCHRAALGGVVHNAKFSHDLMQTARGQKALRHVIETYLRRGGFEIQINVVDAGMLREAQAHPERHADLIVRVAGYSDYFVHLSPAMQEEVISPYRAPALKNLQSSNGRCGKGLFRLAALLLFFTCGETALSEPTVTTPDTSMMARYTKRPVRVDGKLDDRAWRSAAVYQLSLGSDRQAGGGRLSQPGEVRLAWDSRFLYIAIQFSDSDITARGEEDQMHHYKLGDVAEVFLKPENQTWYWELYATPRGRKTSFWLPERGKLTVRDSGLRVAARCRGTLNNSEDGDDRWTAEMAMPVSDLATPEQRFAPGAGWRILVARYNYNSELPTPELSMTPSLSKTNFHRYEEYALLELKR